MIAHLSIFHVTLQIHSLHFHAISCAGGCPAQMASMGSLALCLLLWFIIRGHWQELEKSEMFISSTPNLSCCSKQ